jgi:multisubunit Na+/H+ antiporter MnhB subunit
MSVITSTTVPSEHVTTTSRTDRPSSTTTVDRRPVWRVGLVSGAIAAAANTALAAITHQFGVSLAIAGEQIPILGFAQLTMIGALLGVVIAAVLARRSRSPRTWFVRVTVALTALSLVPDVVADADVATRITLGLTHLVAAAIVVPVIARRLAP